MKYISLKRFKDEILKSNTPPHLTALSFAMGVAMAFSPFPGLHIFIYFLVCKVLRVNGVVVLVGVLVHNPWTMFPIHLSGIMIGDMLLYGELVSVAQFRTFPWEEFGLLTLFDEAFWKQNGHILLGVFRPFFVGHALMSISFSTSSYFLVRKFLRMHKDKKP